MEIQVDDKPVLVHEASGSSTASDVCVLLHGAGMDHRVWDAVQPALAATGARVLALDLPGHGGSHGPAFDRVADTADWVGRVLDALDLQTASLAGHSYGALVALDWAGRNPQRVSSLSLLGVADTMPVNSDLLKTAADAPQKAARLVASWCHGVSKRDDPDGAATWTDAIYDIIETGGIGSLVPDLSACNDYGDAVERARTVTCPVSVVLGSRDKMTPADKGHALADAFAHGKAVNLRCGHMMMLEQPEETVAALQETS